MSLRKRISRYKIFLCCNIRYAHDMPLDIEAVSDHRVCCGKWSWWQRCHTQTQMQCVAVPQAAPA